MVKPHPGVAGFTMWCFADYATLRKKRYKRFSGIVDAWRVPKPGFDFFRACFAKESVCALHGDWSIDGPAEREIHLFTNQPSGVVTLNGATVHTWDAENPHQTFSVRFDAAPLICETTTLIPHGPPATVSITPSEVGHMIEIRDESGNRAANWNGEIEVANGAQKVIAYRPDHHIEVRSGTARVFLKPNCSLSADDCKLVHPHA